MKEIKEEIAYCVGKVMGDGNLDPSFTCRFIGQDSDLLRLSKLIEKKFGVPNSSLKIRMKKAKGVSYLLQVNKSSFGRTLHYYGAPIGNKTKIEFLVPKWIFSDKRYMKRFLQAIFEDELATIKISSKNHSNKPIFKMHKSEKILNNLREFLVQLKLMLSYFSVESGEIKNTNETYVQKDGTVTKDSYFWIQRNKRNIIRFCDNIGFRLNKGKLLELNKVYKVLVSTVRPEIDKDKIMKLRKKGLTIRKIARELKIGHSTVHRVCRMLQ